MLNKDQLHEMLNETREETIAAAEEAIKKVKPRPAQEVLVRMLERQQLSGRLWDEMREGGDGYSMTFLFGLTLCNEYPEYGRALYQALPKSLINDIREMLDFAIRMMPIEGVNDGAA